MSNKISSAENARVYLQKELVRRCQANPKYSLRAFARTLSVEPSVLSKILNGKRAVSASMLKKFSEKLDLTPEKTRALSASLREKRGRSKNKSSTPTTEYQLLADDHFHIVSDWYHLAILELVAVRSFRTEPKWIAKKFNISLAETKDAIERLIRAGFLKIEEDGTWHDRSGSFTNIKEGFTSVAVRRLQKQLLLKAIDALEQFSVQERDQSAMTMAISRSKLTEAKKRVAEFRRELCDFLQSDEMKDSVYQLSISLYPLTFENK